MFCTWGAECAAAYDSAAQKMHVKQPVKLEKVSDTVGAGDAFIAGAIQGLVERGDVECSLEMAVQLAFWKCQNTI